MQCVYSLISLKRKKEVLMKREAPRVYSWISTKRTIIFTNCQVYEERNLAYSLRRISQYLRNLEAKNEALSPK